MKKLIATDPVRICGLDLTSGTSDEKRECMGYDKAVQSVMQHYGCAHLIRFLAPTGSAAALIDGMTVHKGLGLKIKSLNKGKGNRQPRTTREDYSVLISMQSRTHLQEEWKMSSTYL